MAIPMVNREQIDVHRTAIKQYDVMTEYEIKQKVQERTSHNAIYMLSGETTHTQAIKLNVNEV